MHIPLRYLRRLDSGGGRCILVKTIAAGTKTDDESTRSAAAAEWRLGAMAESMRYERSLSLLVIRALNIHRKL